MGQTREHQGRTGAFLFDAVDFKKQFLNVMAIIGNKIHVKFQGVRRRNHIHFDRWHLDRDQKTIAVGAQSSVRWRIGHHELAVMTIVPSALTPTTVRG